MRRHLCIVTAMNSNRVRSMKPLEQRREWRVNTPARHRPIAADLPLPLAAVSATVDFKVFSEIASRNESTAFA
jgi:hypothetical protein